MKRAISLIPTVFLGCAAGAAIALAPSAVAQEPGGCSDTGSATVCQSPGNSDVVVNPPQMNSGDGVQNGPYGPYGNTPPVGNH